MSSRFHAAVRPRAALIDPYLDPDWRERGALIGVMGEGGGETVVALASYDRLRDPRAAEVAFAVADELQGVGIARGCSSSSRCARRRAASSAWSSRSCPGNASMLRRRRRRRASRSSSAPDRRRDRGDDADRADARLRRARRRARSRRRRRVAARLSGAREHRGLRRLGAPRNDRRRALPQRPRRRLRGAGLPGQPRAARPWPASPADDACAASTAPVELAVICVPAAAVLAAADGRAEAGVRSLCVVSAGFAEVGARGAARQDALLALVRAHGGRLIGPNCLGIAATGDRLNATFAARHDPAAGGVGFASQSGALGLAVVEQARERGLGLSAFVSLGNKADVSSNDLLEYWEDDAATTVVASTSRASATPRASAASRAAWRAASRCSPSRAASTAAGARAAGSHTAAIASSDTAVDALFRQSGVVRTRTLSEFLDAALLLSSQPLPLGPRVAVITNAGGLGILFADACGAEGLELPQPSASTRERLRAVMPDEGEPGQSDRPARLRDGRDVRHGASAHPGRSRIRRGVRSLRTAGGGHDGRGRARNRRGCQRLWRAQAGGRRPAHR